MSLTMSDGRQLKTWVSNDTKECFASVARCQGISESRLLRRLVELMLQTTNPADVPGAREPGVNVVRTTRLMVRLGPDDQGLLRERAAARGMAPATYVSVLTRAHLRSLSPLPKEELLALKRSVSQLGIIGGNLNQLARAAYQGKAVAPGHDEVRAMLKVAEGLRDHFKALLAANTKSWEVGHADASH
jgi:hypothetical protein